MKNSFKLAVLALAIAVSAVACKGKSAADGADTTKTDSVVKVDSTVVDSTKKDTTVVVDTTKKDTTKK
jgi:ABC-type glycerol-3-phosphate transport system substrate-binding protein